METRLDLLEPGQQARVELMGVSPDFRERLRDFGLIPGTIVRCRCKSPWRDLTALEFRGAVVALRTRDLAGIRVCRG